MIDPFPSPRLYPVSTPPVPNPDWALFLDLDGTLLDIALTPDGVVVPRDLLNDLAAASVALGGALAVVSGRPLHDVDKLLNPLRFPAAGEHGAVVRFPSGVLDEVDSSVPAAWIERLNNEAEGKRGVLIEPKTHSIAVHYRRGRRYRHVLRRVCLELVAEAGGQYEVLHGKMVFEIRKRGVNKARAVDLLMAVDPFRGRKPVFVGDDITDQDGFRAAAKLGGEGLDVFVRFAGLPREVRRWLKSFAKQQPHGVA